MISISQLTASVAVGVLLSSTVAFAGVVYESAEPAADPVWQLESAYTADVIGVVDGIETPAGRFLDNLDVSLDGDLERQFGWRGARVHFSLLANGGGRAERDRRDASGL